MKKLAFISVLVLVIGICFTVSAFAEFYVIPVQKKDEIVPKTGQTTCYSGESPWGVISCTGTGQDGEHQMGITPEWDINSIRYTVERFTDNSDGTVTDNLTGLIWLKNANSAGETDWASALNYCNNLANNGSTLTDGSTAGDWRLPNFTELQSLVEKGCTDPALPYGHPFTGVQLNAYWSSTTASTTSNAWFVAMGSGYLNATPKGGYFCVWPVRSDN